MGAHFGPAGNSLSFFEKGFKHSYEAPAYVKSLGLDAYEYSAGNGITGGEGVFRRIGEEARAEGVQLSLHTPYFISLSGTDPEKRLKSLSYIEKSLWASELMGADIIVIHCGSAAKISRGHEAFSGHALQSFGKIPRHSGALWRGNHGQGEPIGHS